MILVRHGQSEFNVVYAETRRDPGLEDPHLTDLGRRQIEAAGLFLRDSEHRKGLTRIVASPYTRTLQSATLLAEALDLPILVDADIREHVHFSCDIGSPRPVLEQAWPHLDFGTLPDTWWPGPEDEATVDRRAMAYRARMAEDAAWRETLVVSHWGFIRSLTGQRVANATVLRLDPTQPHPEGVELVTVPDV